VFFFTAISYFKSVLKIFNTVTPVQWLEDISKPLGLLIIFGSIYYLQQTIDLTTVYFVNGGFFLCLTLGLYILISRRVNTNIVFDDSSNATENWVRRCFYFMCIMLGYTFFSKMELLFLGYYAKNEDAAKYQLLLRIADLVILPDFLFNYYLPQKFSHLFAAKDYSGAGKLFRNAARAVFLLQVICLAGVAAVGYFYLQSFHIASPSMYILLLILCSSQLFYSLFGSNNLVLMTSGNERYSFLALAMVLIVEAIANILFIPAFGLQAAVYISWLSVLVYAFILFLFVHKKLKFASPLIPLG
jgi:O-antigen/teichoic acid export membrane protein